MRKPNILFVFSDQQRWDTMGCYGQKLSVTPNLDRLAREGTLFENTFTCQPVCGPARACLQSGRYATEIGCYRNNIALPRNIPTLADRMHDAGYETGYIGKWHLGSTGGASHEKLGETFNHRTNAVPPELRGGYRDYWLAADALEWTSHGYDGFMFDAGMNRVDFKGYRVDCVTDFALEYLRTRTLERPFFLFLSYLEPHFQNDRNRFEGPLGSKERFRDYEVPGDLKDTGGDWRQNYPDYLGCCASIDRNFGRLRAELERRGIWDDTVIFYNSDHGCHFRTRNSEYKRSCHEDSIRVPLIARGPGFDGGGVVPELISSIDIPPTLLSCAGAATDGMSGRAVQPLLHGSTADWPDDVFIQISESQVGRAVRTARWKYSVRAADRDGVLDAGSDHYTEDFLYDLANDPWERRNLVRAPEYASVRAEMARRLKKRMQAAGEAVPVIRPAE